MDARRRRLSVPLSSGSPLDKREGSRIAVDRQRITNGFAIGSWDVLTQTALLRGNSGTTLNSSPRCPAA